MFLELDGVYLFPTLANFCQMANFLAIVTLASFLSACFVAFLYSIELHEDHPILTPLGRFLGVLILSVVEDICTSFLKFSFVLAIVDPDS